MDGSNLESPYQTEVDFQQPLGHEPLNANSSNVARGPHFSAETAPALQHLQLPGVTVEENGGVEIQSQQRGFRVFQCRICLYRFNWHSSRFNSNGEAHEAVENAEGNYKYVA